MRLGILGGSFDPPHVGHLIAASDAYEQLGLDSLVFVPTGTQPLKPEGPCATSAQRLEMVHRLIARDHRYAASAVEIERGGLSFTAETLEVFAAAQPHAERFLLVGADVLATFAKWKRPERIMQLARLAVVDRAGDGALSLPEGVPAHAIVRLRGRRIDISSTEIRARVHEGKPIRGFVPDPVVEYIASEGLYR
jgi:nicotinate-nucleotide adenylyltransferase